LDNDNRRGEALPSFFEECTPDISEVRRLLVKCISDQDQNEFIKQLHGLRFQEVLILAGQRITPGSILDEKAIPPLKESLIISFQNEYHQKLTVGARAWTKHTQRSSEKFWGEIKGNVATKNQKALDIINTIIDQHTWWNMFGHYVHDTVYELRLPSGHGARWKGDGSVFIGFLEPFLAPDD
jgi:hypothetical protein